MQQVGLKERGEIKWLLSLWSHTAIILLSKISNGSRCLIHPEMQKGSQICICEKLEELWELWEALTGGSHTQLNTKVPVLHMQMS